MNSCLSIEAVMADRTIQPGWSRRSLVQGLGGGLGAIALAQMLGPELSASESPSNSPKGPNQPHFAPRAKRVIQLFMNGGPFQADLFDPKPELNKRAGERPEEVR